MRVVDKIRLRPMLGAVSQALQFIQGQTRPHLDLNPMLIFALVKLVEIVQEAAA